MSKEYGEQYEERTRQGDKKSGAMLQFKDMRKKSSLVRQLKEQGSNKHTVLSSKYQVDLKKGLPIQRNENKTGLPDNLKRGMESLSGMNLDHVQVHYNSAKPAAVQAHAYAQGSDIHLASGQEQHLPHELGHVVQQAQGRVKPTTSIGSMQINDSPKLEQEATVMGDRALQMMKKRSGLPTENTIQCHSSVTLLGLGE